MITFGSSPLRVPTMDDMFGKGTPDEIECGEAMNCNVVAVRSKQIVQLRSKETGNVITQFRADNDGGILHPRIRDAAIRALALKDRSDATTGGAE